MPPPPAAPLPPLRTPLDTSSKLSKKHARVSSVSIHMQVTLRALRHEHARRVLDTALGTAFDTAFGPSRHCRCVCRRWAGRKGPEGGPSEKALSRLASNLVGQARQCARDAGCLSRMRRRPNNGPAPALAELASTTPQRAQRWATASKTSGQSSAACSSSITVANSPIAYTAAASPP